MPSVKINTKYSIKGNPESAKVRDECNNNRYHASKSKVLPYFTFIRK